MRTLPLFMLAALLVGGCDATLSDPATSAAPSAPTASARGGGQQHSGPAVAVGEGTATAFINMLPNGRPTRMGVALTADALQGLPTTMSDGRACYDKDEDGEIDPMTECVVGHEFILDFPDQADVPFQYVMLNWNPMGHIPPGVYDLPHFDIHFYIQDLMEVMDIGPGPCPVITNCEDYAVAKIPVPPQYVAPDYIDVDAVEPMMGNHLIDPTGPEFNGEAFTRTFIYGAYGGEITFYEPMITREYLLNRTKACQAFKLPEAWAASGWYPTAYCTDYKQGEHLIYLDDFVYREAE